MTDRGVLILGINGTVGFPLARALRTDGWQVRALVRDRAAAGTRWPCVDRDGIEWIEGDAMDRDAVVGAARGMNTLIHTVNPMGYRDWDKLVLPMIDNSIAAARAAGGARIVLPGTIYNYDPARTQVITETTPQEPRTAKGQIRVELERRLEAVSNECPVLILRAGDFIGPDARSSWFASAMVRPGTRVERIVNPGKGIGHSWAYLPDLAECFRQLLAMPDRLRRFERLQFQGIWDSDGTLIPRVIRDFVGRDLPERSFPWWLMRVLSPFGGFPRAVCDVEPYWRHPIRLDNARLIKLLGSEPHTRAEIAIRDTLWQMGHSVDDPLAGLVAVVDKGHAS